MEVVVDLLKLLKRSSGGEPIFHHRQKHQYVIIYVTAQASYKHKVSTTSRVQQEIQVKK